MPASSPSFDLVMRQKDGTRRWQGRVAAMLASLWAKQCFSQPDPVPWHVEILTKIASQGHFGTGLECSFLPTSSIYHGLVTHNSSLLRVPCLGPLWHAEMDWEPRGTRTPSTLPLGIARSVASLALEQGTKGSWGIAGTSRKHGWKKVRWNNREKGGLARRLVVRCSQVTSSCFFISSVHCRLIVVYFYASRGWSGLTPCYPHLDEKSFNGPRNGGNGIVEVERNLAYQPSCAVPWGSVGDDLIVWAVAA